MKIKYDIPQSKIFARISVGVTLATLLAAATWAQSNRVIVYSKPEQPVTSFAVYIPEKLDTMREQYSASDSQPQIVQGILESALLHSGYKLVNFALSESGAPSSAMDALKKGREQGVDYLIIGQATAFQISGSGSAIGVNVVGQSAHSQDGRSVSRGGAIAEPMRSSAEVSVQVVRVRDGSILLAEEASSTGSAESQNRAGQGALHEAADLLASKLLSSLSLKLKDD
jgi:curli biogenesis system outer membrane secretion channel CsgG